MKIHIYILSLFAALCCVSGCKNKIVIPPIGPCSTPSKNFVEAYNMVSSIRGQYLEFCQAIYISAKGELIGNLESAEYIALSKRYNDLNYNKPVCNMINTLIGNEFDGIEVVSDQDFSPSLPAGASLAGVVKLCGISPLKFIESGYTKEFDWTNQMPEDFKKGNWSKDYAFDTYREYYPVNKLLMEVVPSDFLLLHDGCIYLRFTELPEIKSHNITITLTEGEKKIQTTVKVNF